ncbi:hypothetical protein PPERSA_03355 [Pseudocohnilembus persalinus]|uniref:Uncharacterized protein n=1 Tax=Pseudocohnilembus persalinus TaxID=266149 RepID=A0A0V0R1G3_PSEPJ|nr:hypothetical protein PPERSA_03355 [Pseudocohnilembus persalinus]|eukprot:KRX08361.1 hypothetical protein PPERSA_03355 [Pseudocohnilembus persalinus]
MRNNYNSKITLYKIQKIKFKLDQDKKDSQIKKGWNLMQQQNEEINQEVVRLNQEVLNLTNLLKGSATLYKYKTQEHLKNNLNMNIKYNADHFLKDWQIEKEQLEIAIKETKKEISEHRSIHREILKQLKDVSNNKQGLKDQQSQFLLKKHKILEESIQSNELRCKELEDLVEKLKNFYKLVKYANNMECKFSVRVSLQSQNLNHEITKDISEFQNLANLLETYLPEEKIPELVKIYRNLDTLKSLEEKKLIQSLKQLIEFFFSQHDIRDLREFGQFLGPELQSYLIRPNLDISYNTTINNTSSNLNNNSYIAAQQDSPNTTTEQLLRESLMIRVTEFCNQAQNNNNAMLQQKSQQLQQQQPQFNQNNQNILSQLNFSKQQQTNDKENLPEFAPDNKVIKSNFNDDSPHFGVKQQQNLEYQDDLDMAPTFLPQISEKNCQQQQQQLQQQQYQQQLQEQPQQLQLKNIDFAKDPVKAAEVAAQEQQILKQSLQNINQFTEALRGSFMLNNQQQLPRN